jgi:hypothetical protein
MFVSVEICSPAFEVNRNGRANISLRDHAAELADPKMPVDVESGILLIL